MKRGRDHGLKTGGWNEPVEAWSQEELDALAAREARIRRLMKQEEDQPCLPFA